MTSREPVPHQPPVALTIAGSDSGGGAGIQADLKTMEACGAFGTSAITSITAQNTRGVESTHLLPTTEIEAQLEAVLNDFDVEAAKTGMLATQDIVDLVGNYTDRLPDLVVDPVMVATSGDRLLDPDAEDAYEELIAESTVVTPNADEAAVLTGIDPADEADCQAAGEALLDMGADAALVKGGHVPGESVVDVLVTEETVETFRHPRVDTDATHGSGCTLSSAIAASLAHGEAVTDAVATAINLLARAVRYPLDVGEGPGSVHHMVETREAATRHATAESVEAVVSQFVDRDVSRLVPEVGMNVVGATPYAEVPDETAAVEGKISRTHSGVRANRGVRFGASSTVATVVLAAREFDGDLRFGANARYDDAVASALDDLDGTVVETSDESDSLASRTETAFETADETPVAVVDHGGVEPQVRFLAAESGALTDRVVSLLSAVEAAE